MTVVQYNPANETTQKKGKRKGTGKANPGPKDHETTPANNSDSEEMETPQPKRVKPVRSQALGQLTAYLHVRNPDPPIPRVAGKGSKSAKIPEPTYKEFGVIRFWSSTSYYELLATIAHELPCTIDNLVKDSLQWRLKNTKAKELTGLTSKAGYDAMIKTLQGKKTQADRHLAFYMLPPVCRLNEPVCYSLPASLMLMPV